MTSYHSRVGVTSRLRKRGHDYSSPSGYFITLCTEQRVPLFGEVQGGVVELSPAGAMIDSWLHFIPARFPTVMLDAAVVMPNHLHAIVHLGTDPGASRESPLSDVVRWFKIRTTYDYTRGVKTGGWERFPGRLWQERFYDHIIRTERELEHIRNYVASNPARWNEDDYYPRE